jgi:hypothetical protein
MKVMVKFVCDNCHISFYIVGSDNMLAYLGTEGNEATCPICEQKDSVHGGDVMSLPLEIAVLER